MLAIDFKYLIRKYSCYFIFGCSLLLSSNGIAQPAGTRVIDFTEVENRNDCSIVTVTFVAPVQYLSHFPNTQGKELRVQFTPLVTGQANVPGTFLDEAVRLTDDIGIPITRFDYIAPRVTENPYLWITFSAPVFFDVEQGTDFRSLVIYMSNESLQNCK